MSGIAPEINGHEPPCPERSEDLQSPRKIPLGRRCGKMGGERSELAAQIESLRR